MNIPIRKKWGQNFLIDPNIIAKIISVLNPKKNQHILEIGPGKGALTKKMASMDLNINAIEIDPMLCDYLKEEKFENVKIYNEDILKFDLKKNFYEVFILNDPLKKDDDLLKLVFKIKKQYKKVYLIFINLSLSKQDLILKELNLNSEFKVSKNKNIFFCSLK